MKKTKKIGLLFTFWIVLSSAVFAQTTISGSVASSNGEPVIGASVVEKGTTNGSMTNVNGDFALRVNTSNATLVVSSVGYVTQEITAAGRNNLSIILQEDDKLLSEVVVVGYGVQKKATLTGSVSSVGSDRIMQRSVPALSTALQGTMPGVTIQQTSGQPGVGSVIRVRGIGSINSNIDPLVLVDGIEMDINQVDANTVESVSVLKDAASASIYGSRASNGVILITTKKGKAGKISTSYSGYVTMQRPTNLPDPVAAWEYLQAELDAWDNAGITVTQAQRDQQLALIEQQKMYKPDNWNRYDTDWKKETIKDNSWMNSHNLTLTGGSENVKYFASGSYLNQNGLIPNDKFNRTSLRLNSDITIFPKLILGIETNLRESNTTTPGLSSPRSVINQALYMLPTISAARELDGNWGYGKNGLNPTAIANASGLDNAKSSEVLVGGTLTFTPIEGLELIGQYSRRQNNGRSRSLTTPYTTSLRGQIMGVYPAEDNLTESWSQNLRNYFRTQASYEKDFEDHNFKILGGFQSEENMYTSFFGAKKGFELGKYYLSNGDGATATSGGGASSWAMMSYYSRLNYNYRETYLLELTGRYDGSSRFIPEKRWGFFPSVSAGWVISNESFMESYQSIIDILKLRVSYGLLGNQNIGNYPYTALIETGYGYYLGDGKELATGVAQIDLSNSRIGWEKSRQFNVGVDLTMWNGLLNFTGDVYKKDIYDMLMKFPMPYYAGMSPAFQNAGDMENIGWEIMLGHRNKINDFTYGVTFTLNDNRNKITNLNGLNSQDKTMIEGYPNNGIWGYLTDGYYVDWDDVANSPKLGKSARPGFVKYKKIFTGEGVDPLLIDSRDQVYLGDPFPHFEYGLTLNAGWKGFDFTAFIQGVGQRSTFMSGVGLKPFANGANLFRHQMDSWTPENLDAAYPILVPEANSTDNYARSDKWVRDASYTRLKNVVLGYTLPAYITKKALINSARVYISGQNLLTFSNFYKGYDPEVSYTGGVGGEFYPIMQTITFGLDIKL